MNVFDYLARTASRAGDRDAVYEGTQSTASFALLEQRALRLSATLRAVAGPGDRILIVSENCPQYPEIMFGAWAAGMVVVPVNAKLHHREIVHIVEDCSPSVIFASRKIAGNISPLLQPSEIRLVAIGTDEYAAFFAEAPRDPASCSKDELAWLFYTSGTTGRSKGAMLTHGNLCAMTEAHFTDIDRPENAASLLHAAPMSHGSGLYMLPYIASGSRQVIPQSGAFDPAEFLELCQAHPGIRTFLAPTMVQRLRQEVESGGQQTGNLELVVYGGGPMYVDDMRRSLDCLGPIFAQIYGQGEAPMTITGLTRRDHVNASDAILGSVGTVRSGVEVAIVDDAGQPTASGETGEILCRGDVVMSGYWNNPEATQATLRDGWLHTGDMGSFDEAGYLTLRDRSKDVIISGGSNIYPREVEEVLLRHPVVEEVAVVGEEDAEWGEVVVAHVAATPGQSASEEELDAHCLDQIARFKRPKRYIFHDALPKNAYGKILKRELRT